MGLLAESIHERVAELGLRHLVRRTPRYRSLLVHWLGRRFVRPAAVKVASPTQVEPGQVSVTWCGHATCLVRFHDVAALCDPVLARSLRGIRRELAPGIEAHGLAVVDLVLVSHAAFDHLHLPSLAQVPRAATVVVPPGAGALVSKLGFARLVELRPGSSLRHRSVEVWAEPVKHGGRGAPAQSYVLRGSGPAVYMCGASGYWDGFAQIGRRHWPDIALLPIGGYSPRSFRERYMSPLDALHAFEDLRARVMIPIRHGTFALSYERIDDPARWMAELVAQRGLERFVVPLPPGTSRVFVPAVVGEIAAQAAPPVAPSLVASSPLVTPSPRSPAPDPIPDPSDSLAPPDEVTLVADDPVPLVVEVDDPDDAGNDVTNPRGDRPNGDGGGLSAAALAP